MSKELNERQNAILGAAAAFIEGVMLQPTVYWKNASAQNLPFTLNPRILYRGTGAAIFNEMQCMALQFGITAYIQKSNFSLPNVKFVNHDLVGAVAGGMLTALFASPIELIMIQQQLHGSSFIKTPANIVKTYGLGAKGLMRGLSVTILRDAIYVGSMLGVTPLMQAWLEQEHGQSAGMASFNASIVGGLLASIPSHPADVIKTIMQGDLQQRRYSSASSTMRLMFKQGGVSRFFDGCIWRSLNIVLTVYIANECKNRMTNAFKRF